ncbi:MAG: SDR family oxidoreductase, partial [Actinomycetales bacterium]
VAPGFVDTELTRANNPPEVIAKLLERVPVGRLASTQEIADVVAFLMAESNGYLTGQVITVDGGFACT